MNKVIAAHLLLLLLIACSGRIQLTPAATEVPTEVVTLTVSILAKGDEVLVLLVK